MTAHIIAEWKSVRKNQAVPMLWNDGLTPLIQQRHAYPVETPAATIWAFDDVRVIGPCIPMIFEGLEPDLKNALFPGYVVVKYEDPAFISHVAPAATRSRHVDRAWAVWNYNCIIYGHFLLEAVSRLLLIRSAYRDDPSLSDIPILLPANAPAFARRWIELLLPDFQIELKDADEDIFVGQLMVPNWGKGYIYSDRVQNELNSLAAPYRTEGGPVRRIFVERRVQSYRVLANADALRDIATGYGFEAVSPEKLSLEEQIALFADARYIVGEFSSAMHNALFSPAGCRIMALNYITECQSRIGNFRQHSVGYLLPAEGPINYDPNIPGERHFTIDPALFEKKLKLMLGIA
ncbi:glycosyltransferase family 61 protein [Sphingobium sp. 10 DY56-G10]|uniref:glycosyltransferase family 61 protein n=1 Tax=Sphingomonadales TaxID=204457 RepID=UPI0002D97EE5|nr:glycosyltransferase 61 family protein [Sphingomonas sp. SKA58]|tara:strand:+ start:154 stop:1200 length:1047 start_codon:yes stop_codon:yes gene_type:complete